MKSIKIVNSHLFPVNGDQAKHAKSIKIVYINNKMLFTEPKYFNTFPIIKTQVNSRI